MRTIMIVLLGLIALIGLFAYGFERSARTSLTQIFLSGNIEITEVDISFKIPGRVDKRFVDEGDIVQEGQPIAQLDDVDLMHEVNLQQAAVKAAESTLLELRNGYLPEEIAQAKARADQAAADLKKQEDDYHRQEQLSRQAAISPQEFESSLTAFRVAQARSQEANQYLELLLNGTRPEKIAQAEAQLDQSKQSLKIAETRLSYAYLTSPLSGTVLAKNIEPGEYVFAGTPIVTVGRLDDVWLRGYIDETLLGKIQLGQKAYVYTDTFPNQAYEGEVVFISPQAEFTPKNVQTEKERVKLVYRVKIDIPNAKHELKPGMPADAIILLNANEPSQSHGK